MNYKTLRDLNIDNKTILLRADLNVPTQDGQVTDTTRIDRLKPTLDYLVSKNCKVIVLSHFGRPEGKENPKYSLSFLPPILKKQWGINVGFGKDSEEQVTLLENLRFNAGEEANDLSYAKELASLGDIYINDAFSAAHRAHASTEKIATLMPCAAGLLMESELDALTKALESPKKPVVAIVGGAKISTKLSVLHNLIQKVDYLVLGGGMANTFLFANGVPVGMSLCEKDMAEEAKAISKKAESLNCKIILPSDQVAIREFKANAPHEVVKCGTIKDDQESVDIGPDTIKNIEDILKTAKTILWNGPMGVFEMKPFDNGTNKVAQTVAKLTKEGKLISVAGGGDTVFALDNAGVINDFTYISTAGGAFLEWMEGKELPGVVALQKQAAKAA